MFRKAKKIIAVMLANVLFTTFIFATETKVVVPVGTSVDARVVEDLYPKNLKIGDRILLTVDKNVTIGNNVVISKGARVMAEISDIQDRGAVGKSGKIVISFKTVTAVDEQEIIVSGSKGEQGKDNTVAAVGLGLVCCPLFLLVRGEEGIIKAGQTITIYTIQKAEISVNN